MRFNKKILSLVLAGAMVVSLAPSNVGVVSKMAAASGKMSAKSMTMTLLTRRRKRSKMRAEKR